MASHDAEVIDALEKNKGRWDGASRASRALERLDPRERAEALWQALASGRAEAFSADLLAMLEPGDIRAERVVAVLENLDRCFPGGTRTVDHSSYQLFTDTDIPGYSHHLARFLRLCARSPEAKKLAELSSRLPEPFATGVWAALLVERAAAPAEAPPFVLDRVARARARNTSSLDHLLGGPSPFDPKAFTEALVRAAESPDLTLAQSRELLAELRASCSPERFAKMLRRVTYEFEIVAVWREIASSGEAFVAPLCAELASMRGDKAAWENRDRRWAPGVIVPGLLLLCKASGKAVPDELEPDLEAFFAAYRPPYSGGREDILHRAEHEMAEALGRERCEAMILRSSQPLFFAVLGAPTRAAADRLLAELLKPGVDPYGYVLGQWLRAVAAACGGALVDTVADALLAAPAGSSAQQQLLSYLATAASPESAPALARLLSSKSKPVRQAASAQLSQLPPAAALPALAPRLSSASKDERLSAAEALARLAPSPEGKRLAEARLAAEKVSAIKELLGQVRSPEPSGAETEGVASQVEKALRSGSSWKSVAGASPEQVIEGALAFSLSSLGEKQDWERTLSRYTTPQLYAALDELGKQPGVADAMARRALGLSSGSSALDELEGLCPGFDRALARALAGKALLPCPTTYARRAQRSEGLFEWLAPRLKADMPEAAPLVRAALADKHASVRAAASERADLLAVDALTQLLCEGSREAREAALDALARKPPAEAAPALEKALSVEKDGRLAQALRAALVKARSARIDLANFPPGTTGDASLDRALAEAGAEPPEPLASAALPAARFRSGAALSPGAMKWLLATLAAESVETRSLPLAQLRARLDDESAHALADAALALSPAKDRGWPVFAAALFGSPARLDELGESLETLASSQKTSWGTEGVEALARSGTDQAARWLDHWSRKSKRNALLWRSKEGLTRMARERGISLDDLLDAITPSFGLDLAGRRSLDYGPRQIAMRLDADREKLVFTDEKGKDADSLPSPRAADDRAKVDALKAELRDAKRAIAQALSGQKARLDAALASGKRWRLGELRARMFAHPLSLALAHRLVFAAGTGPSPQLFSPSLSGALEGAFEGDRGAPVALDDAAEVTLAHPAELPEGALDAWRSAMRRRNVSQPIEQLEREVFSPAGLPESDRAWLDGLGSTKGGPLRSRAGRLGLEIGPREDGGAIHTLYRSLGPLTVSIGVTGFVPELPDFDVELVSLGTHRDQKPLPWRTLGPRLSSEVMRLALLLLR